MDAVVGTLLLTVLVPAAIAIVTGELADLAPWLAQLVIRWGVRMIGVPEKIARYEEEWLADLRQKPGNLFKLIWACGTVMQSVPRLRMQFGGEMDNLISQVQAGTKQTCEIAKKWKSLKTARGGLHGRSTPLALLIAAAVAGLSVEPAADLVKNLWELGLGDEAFGFIQEWLRPERIRKRRPEDVLIFFQRLLDFQPGDRPRLESVLSDGVDQWSWHNKQLAQQMLGVVP